MPCYLMRVTVHNSRSLPIVTETYSLEYVMFRYVVLASKITFNHGVLGSIPSALTK